MSPKQPAGNSHGRTSSLTRMVGAFGFKEDEDIDYGSRTHPGLHPEPLQDLPDVGGRDSDDPGHVSNARSNFYTDGFDYNRASGFRSFSTGEPRMTWLRVSPPRSPILSRRSTLANSPELDYVLYALRIQHDGVEYLPITLHTIQVLAPYINGAKPVADITLFANLAFDAETFNRHYISLSAAVTVIGQHCTGSVMVRGVEPKIVEQVAKEWSQILKLLAAPKKITFEK